MRQVSQRGRMVWLLMGLSALVFLLYVNTLDNDFVLDDTAYIRDNYLLHDIAHLWKLIAVPEDAVVEDLSPGFLRGRNVRWITYAIDYAAGDGSPWVFHLSNMAWHLLAGLALFMAARRLFPPFVAATAAVLFLAHPVQTAAVSYVSGRKDILAAFFALLTLWAVARWRESRRPGWLLAVGGLFAAAFYSKESAVVLPVLLLWSDFCLREKGRAERETGSPRSPWPEYLLLLSLAFLFAIRQVGFRLPGSGAAAGTADGNLSFANLMLFYLGKLLAPVNLLADYRGAFEFSLYPEEQGWFWTPLFLATVAVCLLLARRRWPAAALGSGWVLIALLPVSHLVPFHYPVAEHYLYLPCAGFSLAVASGLYQVRKLSSTGAAALLLVLVLTYGAATVLRNRDWQDMETVTLDILAKAPGHPGARNTLVHLYMEQGRTDAAILQGAEALRRTPNSVVTHYNMGILLEERDADRAIGHYREAIRLHPSFWDAYINLGNLLLTQGREEEGEKVMRRLLSGYGYHPLAFYVLGNHLARKGDWGGALEYYRRAAELDPHGAAGYFGMAGALWRLGRTEEAMREFRNAFGRGLNLEWARGQEPWGTFLSDPAVRNFLSTIKKEKQQ